MTIFPLAIESNSVGISRGNEKDALKNDLARIKSIPIILMYQHHLW